VTGGGAVNWLLDYYNYRVVGQYLDRFAVGLANTLAAAGASLVLSLIFGSLLAIVALSRVPVLPRLAAGYAACIRATPLLVQIYLVYFGLPALIPASKTWSELSLGIAALVVNSTPYMAEIIRGGIESVPRGQVEGALAVGLKMWQCFLLVVLPQAFANIVPPLLGQTAVLIKDTSLLSTISVFEFLSAGILLNSDRVMPNESFITIALGYLAIYAVMVFLSHVVQRRLDRSSRPVRG
jgi:polar amino acid transport system permease protein